jgi:hypothetical protein
MRNATKLIRFVKNGSMLDDAPWTWGSTGGWCHDMPEFFQGMPSGVYDNIWEDLDDSPVTWHITEVPCVVVWGLLCASHVAHREQPSDSRVFGMLAARRPHRVPERMARRCGKCPIRSAVPHFPA